MGSRKVLVVTPGSFVIPSGKSSSVETVIYEVTKAANQLYGIDYYIFGRKGKKQPNVSYLWPGMTFYRTSRRKPVNYIREANRRIRQIRPDCIQIENRPKYVTRLRKRWPNRRIILSLHSTTFISPRNISRSRLAQSLKDADLVQVNSSYLANYLITHTPIKPSKIRINYLGVNIEQFPSRWDPDQSLERDQFLSRHGLQGRKIILYVGRLIPIKGVHHIVNALSAIVERIPEALLLIVGGASYGSSRKTAYVKKLYNKSRLFRNHVRFIPYVPHDKIHPWFRAADVCVVPSFRKEAFGLVNVEAMSTGIPIIATNSGGMKEIIEHGVTGLLIEPYHIAEQLGNAVIQLLCNPELQQQMGMAGAKCARERFAWEHTADRLVRLYEE